MSGSRRHERSPGRRRGAEPTCSSVDMSSIDEERPPLHQPASIPGRTWSRFLMSRALGSFTAYLWCCHTRQVSFEACCVLNW